MVKEWLIPLKGKGDPYSDNVRAKCKGSSSDKRKEAQRILAVKKMRPDTIEKRSLELVADAGASATTIMQYMSKLIERTDLSNGLKIQLLGKMCQAHVAIHGMKSKNINIDLSPDSTNSMFEIYEQVKKRRIEDSD